MACGRALLPGLERNRQAWTFAASALRRPAQPDLFLAVVVCASYFAAMLVGLALRLPPSTPSVVWSPNPILTTALLFAPVSRWRVVLLAALPAHLYLQSGVVPLPMAMLLFATNCSEALIAASIIRRFNDQPTRFDTLHRVTVFLVAGGLLAPAISSLLDAAVVARFTSEPYWHVWKVRLWSNMLSAVAIIPAVACVVDTGRRGLLAWPRSRWIESAIIATLLGVGELTASLSHQLNQPLTAISGSAHAGRRFVESGMAASADLAGVFDDITADATRAAEIVKDVRDLLRKDTGEREALDLAEPLDRGAKLTFTVPLTTDESGRLA